MKFTEEKLERAFVELLGIENYPHFHGDSIVRAADDVLIEADLLHYLLTKYESNQLTVTEAKSIVLQLKTLPSSDLYESNKKILRWLSDGFILKREDRNQKDIHIELIEPAQRFPGFLHNLDQPLVFGITRQIMLRVCRDRLMNADNFHRFLDGFCIVAVDACANTSG